MQNFSFSHSATQKLRHIYKQRLYNWLVNQRATMFLKPSDIIAARPTVLGYHEPYLEAFINHFAHEYNDFFIDLGANIGLSSIMVGHQFCHIDCVEPNPLMVNILRTNIAINGLGQQTHIHSIGLGEVDKMSEMLVPSENYGAAFIVENNAYTSSDTEQRLKNAGNAHSQMIDVRDARRWFRDLFTSYSAANYSAGVIKIDVEGYESIIVKALLDEIPKNIRTLVVLENFLPIFDSDQFASKTHDLSWHYIAKVRRPFASIPFKLLGLSSSYRHELQPLTPDTSHPHDIVVFVG